MKRNLRRCAAALLAALLLSLAGCGRTDTPQTNQPAETPGQQTTATKTEPEPAPQPEPEPETDPSAAYAAYLELLAQNRPAILGYDWQKGTVYDEERYESRPAAETAPVVLADVWGDETPELLYFTVAEHEGFRYGARLHIVSYENGAARELDGLEEDVYDSQVGGGSGYRLFQTDGEKNLWICGIYYSEGTTEIYTRLSAEGELKTLKTCQFSSFPVEDSSAPDGWSMTQTYSVDDKPCAEEAYLAETPSQEAQAKGLLVRNAEYYEYDTDAEPPENAYAYPDGTAMTYDGAVAFLRGELGITTGDVDEKAFFVSLPREFSFLSGVGGWSTDIEMGEDGTFRGAFHDSDMGDTGEDYPYGTVYVCSFSGRFGDVKYIDDYTYSMHLKELTIEPREETSIEDGVRYVAGGPYGLENADEILVYLPGSQMSKLPWDFVTWVSMPSAWGSDDRPLLLPFCGLYNVADQEGWLSPSGLSFAWAEDALGPFDDYETFTAEKGDPQAQVLVVANAPVAELKVLALTETVAGDGSTTFETRELGTVGELKAGRPLLVETVFHGDSPNLGFSYVDQGGTAHRVAIDISGYDGSLYWIEF
jgi:predicted small lipoprotein YifL